MDILITIRTEKGTLIINLEHFFPTTQTRCKKLIKVILLDYRNYKALLQQICLYLELEIKSCLRYETVNLKRADSLKKMLPLFQKELEPSST